MSALVIGRCLCIRSASLFAYLALWISPFLAETQGECLVYELQERNPVKGFLQRGEGLHVAADAMAFS